MTRDDRERHHPYRDAEREREQHGTHDRPYRAFGGMNLGERFQGPRERGGWEGGPYETGGYQGGGGGVRRPARGFDIDSSGHRGGYRGDEGYRGDLDRQGHRRDFERDRLAEPEGPYGPRSASAGVAADHRGFGFQDRPTWGDSWGMEEQPGWRGPGEMPGYQPSRAPRRHFAQGTSGGQIPGEFRSWSRGPHAGRGPRNYRRSDERILGELCDRLTADPEIDARDLEVEVHDGKVSLSGAVPDRWMKHRAEDVAESVLGVLDVENSLRVRRGDRATDDRPARTAPTRPSGHGAVLHVDAPELLGSPTAGPTADERRGTSAPAKRRDKRRDVSSERPRGDEDAGGKH